MAGLQQNSGAKIPKGGTTDQRKSGLNKDTGITPAHLSSFDRLNALR
jgi:hypothetical protein